MFNNIDFERISKEIHNEVERRNQVILSKNPNANLNSITQTASIAEIVCITALKAYHEELCCLLSAQPHTTDE